ncbi:hypothetical protein RchiOBHm_Chr1g0339061 [Rosa chinensis]|uniref:Uncharacterized protein n=1 Tax=Rosa chinensis TaxID=74649 RepID=A0A2P6SD45_ROSCH|nr:hypothetical protein RchiOBHm_Chr1g0339061 [Rosa chinensis]
MKNPIVHIEGGEIWTENKEKRKFIEKYTDRKLLQLVDYKNRPTPRCFTFM